MILCYTYLFPFLAQGNDILLLQRSYYVFGNVTQAHVRRGVAQVIGHLKKILDFMCFFLDWANNITMGLKFLSI